MNINAHIWVLYGVSDLNIYFSFKNLREEKEEGETDYIRQQL